jgi:hypothetical protein
MTTQDLLHQIGLKLNLAHYLADFMRENVLALEEIQRSGWTLVDLYANPNGRERGERIAAYPTTVTLPSIQRHRDAVVALAKLSARVATLVTAEEDLNKINARMSRALDDMRKLDRDLARVFFNGNGKSYLSGAEQAALDIEQFCWTSSEGNVSAATDIRHNRGAQEWTRNARVHTGAMHASVPTVSLDEDALLESFEDADVDLIGARLY